MANKPYSWQVGCQYIYLAFNLNYMPCTNGFCGVNRNNVDLSGCFLL